MSGEDVVKNYLARKEAKGVQYAPQGNVAARVGVGLVNTAKNLLPGLYTLPTAVGDLKDIFIDKELPDPNWEFFPGSRTTQHWMEDTDASVRGAAGLPRVSPMAAQNVTDTLLEELPGMLLVPGGAITKLTAAAKLPKAAQLGAKSLAFLAGAPETKLGKAAVTGLVGGADTALIHYFNSKGVPPERAEQIAAAQPTRQDEPAGAAVVRAYLAGKQQQAPAVSNAQGNRVAARYLANKKMNEDAGFSLGDASIAAAVVLSGLAGYKAITKGSAALRAIGEPSAEFGTRAAETGKLGFLGRLKTGMVDKDEPAISFLRSVGDPESEAAADYMEMSRPGGSREARMRAFTGTGKIAGWDGELPSLADDMSAYKLKLSNDERAVLAKGVRAGHLLTMHRKDPRRVSFSDDELRALQADYDVADRDTGEIGRLFRNYRKIGQGMAKYLYDHGMIDESQYRAWVHEGGYFMPTYEDEATGRIKRVYDAVTRPGAFLESSKGGRIKAKKITLDTKLRQPYSAMEEYMYDMLSEVDNNIARKAVVRGLKKVRPDDVRLAQKGDKQTFRVFEDGKAKEYYIKDPDLRHNLAFRPESINVALRGARYMNEIFTKATTGAWNPPQAIASGVYDALAAVGTAPKGRSYTPTVGGVDLGVVPGLGQGLALGQAAIGSMSLMKANMARTFSGIARDYANMGGAWGVSPEFWDKMSKKMGQAFAESGLNQMEQFGAVSSRFMHSDNVVSNAKTVMKELSPEHASIAPNMVRAYNVYHNIFDSIQNGARGYYWLKYGKKIPEGVDANQYLIKLAKDTRQLTGDFGKGGASDVSNTVRAMVPYWNTTIQSWRALNRARITNPGKFYFWIASSMLTYGGTAYLMYNASPQHADWYRNKLSMSDKNRFLWIPRIKFTKDGIKLAPPEQSWAIPQPPEMQLVNAMMSTLMDGMYDAAQTGDLDAKRMWESLGETLQSPRLREQLAEAWTQVRPYDWPLLMKQGLSWVGQEMPMGKFAAEPVYESPYENGLVSPAVSHLLTAYFGVAGSTLSKALDEGYGRMKQTPVSPKGADTALGEMDVFGKGVWDSIMSDYAHRTPMISSLFGHERRRTGGTYESREFQNKNAAIKTIQGTVPYIKDYATGTMGTGVGQMPRMSTKIPVKNMTDKDVRAFMYVDQTMRKLQKQMQVINSNRDKIAEIDNNTRLPPASRQRAIRQRLDKIASVQNYLLKVYSTHMEDVLTNIYGEPTTLEDLADRSTMHPPD